MKSLWNDNEAKSFLDDPLDLRVYTSRLLGRESGLVLHGGGNTSLKAKIKNFFGDIEEVLYIKGSGWDLKTIQAAGFAPVKLKALKRMAELERLSDMDMVGLQKTAMIDHLAPNPSIEAILHAIIPFKYVDHTHADAVVTITNNEKGKRLIREIYKDSVLIVPYVMSGFILAKKVYEMTRNINWHEIEGIILMNHGLFTFSDNAKASYKQMIHLVSLAEDYLKANLAFDSIAKAEAKEDLLTLAKIRKQVSLAKGSAMIARLDSATEACGFANLTNVDSLAVRGPLTPDHVVRTKQMPVVIKKDIKKEIIGFCSAYKEYFKRNTDGRLLCLDPAPRWGVWPGHGIMAFGQSVREANIVSDIAFHTIRAIQWGEAISGWKALPEKDIFDMEYWELQQSKLRKEDTTRTFQGKIALVTGAASGIGLACAEALHEHGAAVVGMDLNPAITRMFDQPDLVGLTCDISDDKIIKEVVEFTVRSFGGLDILINNAGIFTHSQSIEEMDAETWNRSMEINLSSHQRLLKICIPYLKQGVDPSVIFIASKNVHAPGPGASAYSVAKAGLTQLARVAALELAADGIRVNIIHPDAVFDTGIWTQEVLNERAKHYGLSVEEYKTKNLLKTEVTSKNVADLVCCMAGPAFAKTTGAQIPIDGGNERVI
ncbi:MAG: bifunctional aldolase/short-chain dehydrogenase [Desulfobacteraceae bacterium]|nr:bifunctional aldolase/short-chain dehydrogenase [Pseudomonadota bacterium]MBU4463012.1 bifunctional aldolase/short-chain dehydrogenase [Pseudomonadota bacterium]MCG2754339.1 bifunctional aldolase/short-chain dehydrogenase [Desulfobacteraceae bacterium]